MRTALRTVAIVLASFVLVLVLYDLALAQDPGGPPLGPNPNPPQLVAWCAVAYAAMSGITSILREDNTALPFAISAKARAWLLLGLGMGESFALAVTKSTPWAMAIVIGLGTAGAAYAAHGERALDPATQKSVRPPPPDPAQRGFAPVRVLAVLTFLVCSGFACGILGPGGGAAVPDAAALLACERGVAASHQGIPLPQFVKLSLETCAPQGGVLVADVLEHVLESSDPALAPYKAEALATRGSPPKLGALRAAVGHP